MLGIVGVSHIEGVLVGNLVDFAILIQNSLVGHGDGLASQFLGIQQSDLKSMLRVTVAIIAGVHLIVRVFRQSALGGSRHGDCSSFLTESKAIIQSIVHDEEILIVGIRVRSNSGRQLERNSIADADVIHLGIIRIPFCLAQGILINYLIGGGAALLNSNLHCLDNLDHVTGIGIAIGQCLRSIINDQIITFGNIFQLRIRLNRLIGLAVQLVLGFERCSIRFCSSFIGTDGVQLGLRNRSARVAEVLTVLDILQLAVLRQRTGENLIDLVIMACRASIGIGQQDRAIRQRAHARHDHQSRNNQSKNLT